MGGFGWLNLAFGYYVFLLWMIFSSSIKLGKQINFFCHGPSHYFAIERSGNRSSSNSFRMGFLFLPSREHNRELLAANKYPSRQNRSFPSKQKQNKIKHRQPVKNLKNGYSFVSRHFPCSVFPAPRVYFTNILKATFKLKMLDAFLGPVHF